MEFEISAGVKYRLRGLHGYEGKKSVHQIVQSCKLELPLSVMFRNNDLLERVKLIDKIKEGDKVTINLGYNDKNVKEFEGYIKRINPKIPLELEIEDSMYLLRKIRLNKNFKKAQVREVLQYITDELHVQQGVRFVLQPIEQMPAMEVYNFFMREGCDGIAALQALQDVTVVLQCYLTEIKGVKTLYCGFMYGLKKQTIKYVFNRNTISLDELKYNQPAIRSFRVEVRVVNSAGKVKKYQFFDKHGEFKRYEMQGDYSEESVKKYAEGRLQWLQAVGYKGAFTTFLIPSVEPGDIGACTDNQFRDRSGDYYISSVTTTFGSGGRRKPEIEIRL